jgi:hypothetical protein
MSVQSHLTQNHDQAMAVESGMDEASLPELLLYCSKHLGLQGLACLAASSRGLRTACQSVLQTDAVSLLIDELRTAELDESLMRPEIKLRHAQAAAWALRLAPTAATAAGVTEQLLCQPMSRPHALQILESGVKVSYAQLLAAAA